MEIPEDIRKAFAEMSYEERVELIGEALANMNRPEKIKTKTRCLRTGCGNAYITYSVDEEFPHEIFCILGKTGGCAAAHMESLARVITEALKAGIPKQVIIKHLKGIQCPNSSGLHLSCPEAVAIALEEG